MKYITRISLFESGERFPVLLYEETYQPVILSLRYIVEERRDIRQVGTIEREVRVIKWLPSHAVPFARRAVEDLTRLCDDARRAAALLEQNPDRIPLDNNFHSSGELVDKNQLSEIMGLKIRTVRQIVDSDLKVQSIKRGNNQHSKNLYRLGDIEKALLSRCPELEIIKLTGS
ncbi:MAG: hypothetical protein ACR2N3_01540 [Pyrinomonadaceae bacterium]